jgi:hypothetical protein
MPETVISAYTIDHGGEFAVNHVEVVRTGRLEHGVFTFVSRSMSPSSLPRRPRQNTSLADAMDRAPRRINVGSSEPVGPRTAFLKRSPPGEWGRWCVWRQREDGSFDLTTCHVFRWHARLCARLYERRGKVRGYAP